LAHQQHIKIKSNEDLASLIKPFLHVAGINYRDEIYLLKIIGLMKERLAFPQDFINASVYFFQDPNSFDEAGLKKNWELESCTWLKLLADQLKSVNQFVLSEIESRLRQLSVELQIKRANLFIQLDWQFLDGPLVPDYLK